MEKNWIKKLQDGITEVKESTSGVDSLVKQIEYYESFIPEFFSSNGEAKGIKDVFNAITENARDKKITCVDVNKGSHIYDEYLEGMKTFINDIQAVSDVDETVLESFEEKLNNAKEKDSEFIKSLFGGNLNTVEETTLESAVTNIEYLVDFIPKVKMFKEDCKCYASSIQSMEESTKKTLVENSINMLLESVSEYCLSTVGNIVSTYYDISDCINKKEVVEESFKLL